MSSMEKAGSATQQHRGSSGAKFYQIGGMGSAVEERRSVAENLQRELNIRGRENT